jgi:hypothetical protein
MVVSARARSCHKGLCHSAKFCFRLAFARRKKICAESNLVSRGLTENWIPDKFAFSAGAENTNFPE